MEHPTTLIYLMDQDTLRRLHRGWPAGIRVALCLTEAGESHIALLHEDEIDTAAERVADLFALDDADFVIVPKLGGYPTRKISFSEDQQLCGMVADIEDLAEIATDILLERIGAADLPGAEENPPEPEVVEEPLAAVEAEPEHEIEVEEVPVEPPAPVEPEATAHEEGPRDEPVAALPPGFRPVTACEDSCPTEFLARLVRSGATVRLKVDGPARRFPWRRPQKAVEVGISEDQRRICLVLPPNAGWTAQPGAEISVRREALPVAWQPKQRGLAVRADLDPVGGQVTLRLRDLAPPRRRRVVRPARSRTADAAPALLAHAFSALIVFAMIQIGFSDAAREHMNGAAEHVASWRGE